MTRRGFIDKVYAVWMQYPELRFGQLLDNAIPNAGRDIFYMTDEELLAYLKAFCEKHAQK